MTPHIYRRSRRNSGVMTRIEDRDFKFPIQSNSKPDLLKKFTLYWLTGQREVIQGRTLEEAVISAGYGSEALRALDFWAEGEPNTYQWDSINRTWTSKSPQQ